ncbi:E3 SUMO-protein ligase ZBED1 [Labeo rohita]|uniref:E3 SUMO-protein ligase ZBED1 n=1 Tax=Labeo rohita TaxID=84645 RepID=A0ABQ8L3P0_LABRO|nr:E3 SUMO-protein ligase ZBED1 [Labeo rohita]
MSGSSDESESNLELLSKDVEIVDKKGSTNSVIWKWFGYLKNDEAQIKTICKICRRFASSGAVPKQKSILSSFVAITPYERCSKRSKDITRAVSNFLAKDMMPLSTVEQDGFRKLVKVLDSRYKLPGRKYFSKTALPQLYEECRGKLENNLRNVRYFATTTDL